MQIIWLNNKSGRMVQQHADYSQKVCIQCQLLNSVRKIWLNKPLFIWLIWKCGFYLWEMMLSTIEFSSYGWMGLYMSSIIRKFKKKTENSRNSQCCKTCNSLSNEITLWILFSILDLMGLGSSWIIYTKQRRRRFIDVEVVLLFQMSYQSSKSSQ